jgi:hypothetical protein
MSSPPAAKKTRKNDPVLPEVLYTPKEMHGKTYLKQIKVYCDKLGDHLMLAAVEHKISKGITVDPSKMLDEWERDMRIPIAMHVEGAKILSISEQDKLFTRMHEMHKAIDADK